MQRETGSFPPLLAVLGCALLAACGQTVAADRSVTVQDGQTTVIQSSGDGTNHITVSGNQAGEVVVGCDAQGNPQSANVNSVKVDGASLKGKTVIVSGHNSPPVQVRADCSRPGAGSVNVNSVTIR